MDKKKRKNLGGWNAKEKECREDASIFVERKPEHWRKLEKPCKKLIMGGEGGQRGRNQKGGGESRWGLGKLTRAPSSSSAGEARRREGSRGSRGKKDKKEASNSHPHRGWVPTKEKRTDRECFRMWS